MSQYTEATEYLSGAVGGEWTMRTADVGVVWARTDIYPPLRVGADGEQRAWASYRSWSAEHVDHELSVRDLVSCALLSLTESMQAGARYAIELGLVRPEQHQDGVRRAVSAAHHDLDAAAPVSVHSRRG